MELEKIKKLTALGEEEYLDYLEKGCRPAFGSPGGKRYLAKTIVSYIPEHKTYIENFVGGGAVFFAKEPSEVEVINDLDKDIAFAYRFIKNMTDEQFKLLKKKIWKASKTLFEKLKNLKTDEPLEKFRKIIYLKKLSYGESGKNYDQTNEGRDLTNGLDSLLRIKERLKNVKIENNDYKKSTSYDSKETFYYLDPPYPETNNVGDIDLTGLHEFCKNLKGKFILSLNDKSKNVNMFRDFNIKKVRVSQQMLTGGSQMQMRTELLISNFPLKKENIYLSKSEEALIGNLPSFMWIPEFINIAGSLFYEREDNRKPNDIDIIVRAKEEDGKFTITLDKSLRLKIDRILEKRVGEISGNWLTPEWLGSTFGPNWKYQTGWDLVLIPHQPQEIREINEPEFAEEFYKEEDYEEFCDFGGGQFSKFVKEHPEFNSEEFREYVIGHNKADRDSGELEDIAAPEILRLAKEFAQEKNIQIEKRHSREKCMECDKPPVYECIWAEGIGHAWFCKEHFKEWATNGDGKGEIISVKEVKDGIAAKKFGENRNPNIWAELKREFSKEWMNSPTFAYHAVYGKSPDLPLRGRTDSPKRMWNDKEVDKEFKDTWLKDLNDIPDIEIRATDIGHSTERVAFVVFRFKDKENDNRAKDLADKMNKLEGLYCKSDIGTEGRPRICVAGKIKLGDKNWEGWWNSLAGKIKGVVGGEIKQTDTSKIKDLNLDEIKKGLYLVPPHGKLIYENKKTAIVKSKDFDIEGKYFILVSDKKAYGYIECSKGKRISLEEFKKRNGEHLISEEERKEWWPLKKTFYLYKIRTFIPFKKLKDIILERGVQTFIEEVQFEKLQLEEFRQTGIDEDMKNPAVRHKELFADLRYLGNSAYPRIIEGKKWKDWTKEDILKYYAAIVDCLRSVFYPIIPPKIGEEGYSTSYWECYRASRKYMKSKPPAEKEVKEWNEKRKEIIKGEKVKKSRSRFKFMKIDKTEFIVGGVVYYSNKQDSQEDWAKPPEVWKALKHFMLKKKTIKIMHKGIKRDIPIVENYFVEERHHKGGTGPEYLLEKGDWWLAVYLGDKENKDIWKRVLKGELTGFSMAGRASSP